MKQKSKNKVKIKWQIPDFDNYCGIENWYSKQAETVSIWTKKINLNSKPQLATPHKIYAYIWTSRNRQTFNKNIATAEKSPIFTSHKSYKNSLCNMAEKNLIYREKVL